MAHWATLYEQWANRLVFLRGWQIVSHCGPFSYHTCNYLSSFKPFCATPNSRLRLSFSHYYWSNNQKIINVCHCINRDLLLYIGRMQYCWIKVVVMYTCTQKVLIKSVSVKRFWDDCHGVWIQSHSGLASRLVGGQWWVVADWTSY